MNPLNKLAGIASNQGTTLKTQPLEWGKVSLKKVGSQESRMKKEQAEDSCEQITAQTEAFRKSCLQGTLEGLVTGRPCARTPRARTRSFSSSRYLYT